MNTVTGVAPLPRAVPALDEDAPRYRFSREDYHRLSDTGLFIDKHTELIDGQIIVMPGKKEPHSLGTTFSNQAMRDVFDRNAYWVRNQEPLVLGQHEPEPDCAVILGSARQWAGKGHPTSALLIIEVSDRTLRYDRRTKSGLYAAFGIADYWILNLVDGRLEVHRDPVPDAARPFGHGYASVTHLTAFESIAPLAAPAAVVRVADLLP